MIWSVVALIALGECAVAAGRIVNPRENEISAGRANDGRLETGFRYLSECLEKDLGTCVGVKAVAAMTRLARMDDVKIFDGVRFVRSGEIDRTGRALSESELENSLPAETGQKRSRLIDLFFDAAFRFIKSHSLQLKMPDDASADLERALQEGRGKLKKSVFPILLAVGAKVFAVVPILLGGLALMVTKALVIAKIAFVIAAILGLQKLLAGGGGGFGGLGKVSANTGWNSGSSYSNAGGWSGGSSGPYYRSFSESDESHEMAYSAQTPKTD